MKRILLFVLCLLGLGILGMNQAQAQACSSGACVAAGPRLVSVDSRQSALLNTLLQALLPGTGVQLSVLDWNALAGGDVRLTLLLERLRANLNLSSTDEVLGTNITLGQLLVALADVAQADGNTALVNALNTLRVPLGGLGGSIRLADLLSVQFPQGALTDVGLDVLDLITSAVQLYNHRNVATTPAPVQVNTAALGLTGVAALRVYAQVVEPPVYVCGRVGSSFHTAAIRLKLDLTLASGLNTAALTTAVSNILAGLTLNATNVRVEQLDALRVSVYVEVAQAEGTISGLDLLASAVTLQARPGLVNLFLGQIPDPIFFNRTRLLTSADVTPATAATLRVSALLPIADITLDLGVQLRGTASGRPELLTQTYTVPFPQTRTFSSGSVSASALVTSLLNNLEVSLVNSGVNVRLLGTLPLPLPIGTITDALLTGLVTPLTGQLTGLLTPVLGTVLGGLVDPLLNLLGIQIGQAVFSVAGITRVCPVSGTVYRDLQPDGTRDAGESWSGTPNVYVNLVQGGRTVQSVLVTAGSGAYTFAEVPRGTFSVLVTAAALDTTPRAPAGWILVTPESGMRSVTVDAAPVASQDFGLFEGARVRGLLFADHGLGAGVPNDARRNGQEPPAPGVTVSLTGAGQSRAATTGTDGRYTLYWPAAWGPSAALTVADRPVAGFSNGTTATLAADFAGSNVNPLPLDVTSGRDLTRDFGVVEASSLTSAAPGATGTPGRVRYAHLYRPGTLGTVTLAASGTVGYGYTFARDLDCDGTVEDSERAGLTSFTVDGNWPREPDGRLRACALEVEVRVPAGQPTGTVDTATVTATLTWEGRPVQDPRGVTDTTAVTDQQAATLTKRVRNLTRHGAGSGLSSDAFPGERLEYCLDYRNLGVDPLTQLVLADHLTLPLQYVPGTLARDGVALTDQTGDDDGDVTGQQVVVRLAALNPGAGGSVCFQVTVP
ncbi:hypothetical protein Dcar01_03356 [Deinococcus carri]|uniref:SD-repeat containing protein B domain-containing protein n=1 Tax=Deinococcus carri TaxID=1211323 RepID=A0ABP9WCY6_9DEIO